MSVQPSFLVIGAGRAGTTSLHYYLAQHPGIFMPSVKAPSYWYAMDLHGSPLASHAEQVPSSFVTSAPAYAGLFAGCAPSRVAGEVSPVYLASTRVAARIAHEHPGMRIVSILRNPVDRVYARYLARRRDGLEPIASFEALVERESTSPLVVDDAHATYLAGGMVSHVLRTYHDAFPESQRLTLWFDDFARDTPGAMRTLFRFLQVDDSAPVDVAQSHNRSGGRIRNPAVRRAWAASYPVRRALRPWLPAAWRDRAFLAVTRDVDRLPMHPDTRAGLIELYRTEIDALSALTGRDLTFWTTRSPSR